MTRVTLPTATLLLVLASRSLLHPVAAETTSTLPPQRQQEIAGLVQQDCGSCHGLTLKGGLGPSLDPVRLRHYPPAYIEQTILHGRPGTPMPPWGPLLTSEEIRYIASQLLSGVWYVP